jgi:hypothetical protein
MYPFMFFLFEHTTKHRIGRPATGTEISGDLVVWKGGTAALTQNTVSGSNTYSNTATTLTIGTVTVNVAIKYSCGASNIACSVLGKGVVSLMREFYW